MRCDCTAQGEEVLALAANPGFPVVAPATSVGSKGGAEGLGALETGGRSGICMRALCRPPFSCCADCKGPIWETGGRCWSCSGASCRQLPSERMLCRGRSGCLQEVTARWLGVASLSSPVRFRKPTSNQPIGPPSSCGLQHSRSCSVLPKVHVSKQKPSACRSSVAAHSSIPTADRWTPSELRDAWTRFKHPFRDQPPLIGRLKISPQARLSARTRLARPDRAPTNPR